MNPKTLVVVVLAGFVVLCGSLVVESGLLTNARTSPGCTLLQQATGAESPAAQQPEPEAPQMAASQARQFSVTSGRQHTVVLGAQDPRTENPETGFKFQLLLNTQGAAIARATFSDGQGKGFDDRNQTSPEPLVILSPSRDVMSMANTGFVFDQYGQQLPLDKVQWKSLPVQTDPNGSKTAGFEAIIRDKATGEPAIRLLKTYSVTMGSYLVECALKVENLGTVAEKTHFNLAGPVGIGKEDVRADERKAIAAFRKPTGEISTERFELTKFDMKATRQDKEFIPESGGSFLWSAIGNNYFAAVLIPVPQEGQPAADWIAANIARFYNPDGTKKGGDENIAVAVRTVPVTLEAAGGADSTKEYKFNLYLGPKDKRLFDKSEYYRSLGLLHTIDFRSCCCPAGLIGPLAFGILAIMEWMYKFIPNYGIVIIILVFVVRIILHPLTKKSQVSMSKMSKLGPRAEEIKKKYANNKQEMNRELMSLYKEQGASPIMGMVPMFAQMPIWIALWSAIYTGIALRGASLDPWWITDLSAPDSLFTLPMTLPFVGNSFNLLPILMGGAFWLQQKMTPQPAATSPQIEQQQKMMKIMLPVLFPVMLYNGPSGVNLYIMSSVFAGAIEQNVIRKHIQQKDEQEAKGLVSATSKTGGKVKKKKPRPFLRSR